MDKQSNLLLSFGKKIRLLRMSQNLSQEDLAILCGLDRTYISSLERGQRNVSLKNIAILASALRITLPDLFQGISTDE